MKRKFTSYAITDFDHFKYQLLSFGKRFSNFCFLDSHGYEFDHSYDCIAGFGNVTSVMAAESSLHDLDQFRKEHRDWIFGHIAYDLKNEIEDLYSVHPDRVGFPDFHFFVPEIVFLLSKDRVSIGSDPAIDPYPVFKEISSSIPYDTPFPTAALLPRFSRAEYLETVKKLQQHILRGDCYEICFCQEFFAENSRIDPFHVFKKLSELSPNPFSAFYRSGEKYLLCASPERFLKKTKNVVISQPIKGTSKRTGQDPEKERKLLSDNEKERAENIMIVDLVRNDLSKICTRGSVKVKEFLKIYSFPQVHQMISTITGTLRDNIPFSDIITATFPMGSMTGAPKKRAMELIELYEKTKRGLFSGSVGYMNPDGDFDFNVVIRSILYNEVSRYLSVQAGSAITWKSIPLREYEECLIKIAAMKKALSQSGS